MCLQTPGWLIAFIITICLNSYLFIWVLELLLEIYKYLSLLYILNYLPIYKLKANKENNYNK